MLSVELTKRIVQLLDSKKVVITTWCITPQCSITLPKSVVEYNLLIDNIIRLTITSTNNKLLLEDSTSSIKKLLTANRKSCTSTRLVLNVISTFILDKNIAFLITALGIIKTTFCVDLFNFTFIEGGNKNIVNQLTINSIRNETIIATAGTLRWPITRIEFVEKKDVIEYLI